MTYIIEYKNKKGKNITARSIGLDSRDAVENYGNRKVFGCYIFPQVSTQQIDARTQGQIWGKFTSGEIKINVEVCLKQLKASLLSGRK